MRFYTQQHQYYCGIDLHARTMYVCILDQTGRIVVERNMASAPEPFLTFIAGGGPIDGMVSRFFTG